jgi:L-lactate dehydrogenase complex protein LldF
VTTAPERDLRTDETPLAPGPPRSGTTFLGLPTAPRGVGHLRGDRSFPDAARDALRDGQLRANLGHATSTIRRKRAAVVGEVPDWEQLRRAGKAIKTATMARLDEHLVELERQVTARGGTVHWARDADEANAIVTRLVQATGADEVVKVKSMATQEIGLNEALESAGITAHETDLAELIVQLGDDAPSHILVPAIHKNRAEIREIFLRTMEGVDPELTDEPRRLAMAARKHLRERFLRARVAISGANFAIAETGTLAVVESEGNGRMCLTLPQTLITVMGIEKLLPTWRDLEVFLQLLPRSSTGERMNPYTSMWTGVTPGDGPQEFHLVLLDNGRTAVLADEVGREALHCIRCSACLNVCPVYERTGGHSYGSVYPGPIGAILSPQLTGVEDNASLPYASSLCGACYDACPVAIDIPSILVHLRAEHVEAQEKVTPEAAAFRLLAKAMSHPRLWHLTQRAAGLSRFLARGKPTMPSALPPPASGWTRSRDLPTPPRETFTQAWAREHGR